MLHMSCPKCGGLECTKDGIVQKKQRYKCKSCESIRSTTEGKVVEMDEMHTYIGSKKTIAGSGLLLIEMQKDSSTAKWVHATHKQVKSCGKPLNITK